MKKLFVLFLMTLPLANYSQENGSKKNKISIGISFSPDYCYRILKATDETAEWIKNYRDTTDIPMFGYTTGANFRYEFNEKFALESGLFFSDKGDKTEPLLNFETLVPDPYLANIKNISNTYHYYYLDVPVKANYKVINKRLSVFLSAGFAVNIFLRGKTIFNIEYKDGTRKKESSKDNWGLKDVNLSVTGGIGIDYNFSKKLFVRIEPTYRRSITSISGSPLKGYLYSFGVNTGLFCKL